MPRGKKKSIKTKLVKGTDDKVIKDTDKKLNKGIEKEHEIIEPVIFRYIGPLTKTTTVAGIVEKNVPFTISDANQINHFKNLNTFEELPKGYKISQTQSPNDDKETLSEDVIDKASNFVKKEHSKKEKLEPSLEESIDLLKDEVVDK